MLTYLQRVLANGQTYREVGTQSYGSHEMAGLPTSHEIAGLPNHTNGSAFLFGGGMSCSVRNEWGLAGLMTAVVTALIFSLAAFAVLVMALARAQQNNPLDPSRLRARYAAEAGIVWATYELWNDPRWDSPPGWAGPPRDIAVDTDADGKAETKVDLIMPACVTKSKVDCEDRKLQAFVTY